VRAQEGSDNVDEQIVQARGDLERDKRTARDSDAL
jgi:hypothetical protein